MKKFILILLIILLAGGVYFGYKTLYPKPMPKPTPTTLPGSSAVASPDQPMTFTLSQLAQHGGKDNCWLAIDGKVYDMTPFVASGFHPGKEAILQGCGGDATELFNTRPMGSKTSHSERARSMLPKYFIGNLAN